MESTQSIPSNPQKILILSLGRSGGCVRYATEIVDAMTIDCEVYVSSYSTEKSPKNHRKIRTYTSKFQFVISLLTVFPFLWFKILFGLLRGRYSVIYFPYKHFWNIFFLYLFKWAGKKTVMTVHDGILHAGEENRLEQWLVKVCIRQADELIFLTDFVRKNVSSVIGFRGHATVIPHGMFTDFVWSNVRHLPEKPRLLFLGRISKYKGVEMLLKAVRQLPKASYESLTIAGKSLYDIAIDRNDKKIIFVDKWLNNREVEQLLRGNDILVLPYLEASQSGVIPMGIAAALPMVCTRVGGLGEQLKEDEAVLTAPNVETLKAGISRLLGDAILYKHLSEKMLEKQAELGWESIAKQVEAVLRR